MSPYLITQTLSVTCTGPMGLNRTSMRGLKWGVGVPRHGVSPFLRDMSWPERISLEIRSRSPVWPNLPWWK